MPICRVFEALTLSSQSRTPYPTAASRLWLSLPSPSDPGVSEALGGLHSPEAFMPQVSLWERGHPLAPHALDAWGWRPAPVPVRPPACLSGVEESLSSDLRNSFISAEASKERRKPCKECTRKRSAWVEFIVSGEASGGENVGSCGLKFSGERTCLVQQPCGSGSLSSGLRGNARMRCSCSACLPGLHTQSCLWQMLQLE